VSDTALTCGALLGLALGVALVAPAVGDAARPTPARGLTLVVDWKAKVSIRQAPGSRTLAVAKWKTPFGSVRRLQVVARRGIPGGHVPRSAKCQSLAVGRKDRGFEFEVRPPFRIAEFADLRTGSRLRSAELRLGRDCDQGDA